MTPGDMKLIFGPLLLGVCGNLILYGVLLIQIYTYFTTYKNDGFWLNLFIVYILLVETLNSGMDIDLIYEPFVTDYGLPQAMKNFPMALAADPILTAAISTPIQIFIAYRIRLLSDSWIIPIIITFFAFASLGGAIYASVLVVVLKEYSKKATINHPALVWLLSSMIDDALITYSLCYNLWKKRTGFMVTDATISKIILLTIQTGFITTIFATLDVACFLAFPNTTLNFIWDFALSKLYSNVLLSTLNARAGWRSNIGAADAHNVLFDQQRNFPCAPPTGGTGVTLTQPEFVLGKYETSPGLVTMERLDLELGDSIGSPSSVIVSHRPQQ